MSNGNKGFDWKWLAGFVVAVLACIAAYLALIPLVPGLLTRLTVTPIPPVKVPSTAVVASPSAQQPPPTQPIVTIPPTETSIPPSSTLPPPTASPIVIDYVTIEALGTRHIALSEGELIVGTADRFQDETGQPPCTAFLIKGPVEMDLTLWYGGWDHWINVYNDKFAEYLLANKVAELERHQTCPQRGIKTVRLS